MLRTCKLNDLFGSLMSWQNLIYIWNMLKKCGISLHVQPWEDATIFSTWKTKSESFSRFMWKELYNNALYNSAYPFSTKQNFKCKNKFWTSLKDFDMIMQSEHMYWKKKDFNYYLILAYFLLYFNYYLIFSCFFCFVFLF